MTEEENSKPRESGNVKVTDKGKATPTEQTVEEIKNMHREECEQLFIGARSGFF